MDLVEAIDSPAFQINAQIHQMAYTDLDVPTAIRAMGDRITLVHIADIAGSNPIVDPLAFMTPGQGRLDFGAVFTALKDIGYDGEVCMEPSPETLGDDVAAELRTGRELLEAKWRQV
jgi:protein FrlC